MGWSIVWTVLLGLLALLVLLLVLPVSLRIAFRGELTVRIRIVGIPFRIYPRRERPEKEKQAKKQKAKKRRKTDKKEKKLPAFSKMLKEDGVSAVISYYASLARLIETGAKRLIRVFTVDHLYLHMTVASGEASETAQDYGRACAVIFPAEALLESVMRIRRRSVRVIPDFLASKGRAEFDIRLHAVPARILWVLLRLFISFIWNQNMSLEPQYKEADNHG